MARTTAIKMKKWPEKMRIARLALIRKRHRQLILQPRELIAAHLDEEFDEMVEADDFEVRQTVEPNRL